MTVGNLIYLTRALDRPDYLPYAEGTILAALPFFRQVPTAMPRMGMALVDYLQTGARAPAAPGGPPDQGGGVLDRSVTPRPSAADQPAERRDWSPTAPNDRTTPDPQPAPGP